MRVQDSYGITSIERNTFFLRGSVVSVVSVFQL